MPALRTSIVLCTFNGARFLEPQVASVFAQERAPDEIVAVDDASVDGSFVLLEKLALRSPVAMRVYRNEATLGAARNFERAIALAQGDVIFLCDQDDVWSPEKTRTLMTPFESDERVMLVHSDAALVDAELRQLGVSLFQALGLSKRERMLEDRSRAFEVLLRRSIVTGATAAIRREAFEWATPFPPEWLHDEWLAVIASLRGRLIRIERPLIQYRQHGANQIGAQRRGIVQKLKFVLASGGDYQRRKLDRMRQLRARLPELAAEPGALRLTDKTLEHACVRASLSAARWRRVPTVLRELVNLHYFRYSVGWTSAIRDLLGPIDSELR